MSMFLLRNTFGVANKLNSLFQCQPLCFSVPYATSTMNTHKRSNNIVWMDLEMTGLNIDCDHILEIACIVTDSQLNIIAEGPDIIIHQTDSILNNMGDWCTEHHRKTGLTSACQKSTTSLAEAENIILEFVKIHVAKGESPLAGNSVYMDRLFLRKYMPMLDSYLHYRIIDVSTVKELCRRWLPPTILNKAPVKRCEHRALSDIKESISELLFYKENAFKN